MNIFQIFTLAGIALTIVIGICNLWLNIKNQRKSHRELIFQKQFEFFMKFQKLVADLDDLVTDINEDYADANSITDKIIETVEELDIETTRNEIIIPDELYGQIHKFLKQCREISSLATKDPLKINAAYKDAFIERQVVFNEDLREFIGIEKLCSENRGLVGNKLSRKL